MGTLKQELEQFVEKMVTVIKNGAEIFGKPSEATGYKTLALPEILHYNLDWGGYVVEVTEERKGVDQRGKEFSLYSLPHYQLAEIADWIRSKYV